MVFIFLLFFCGQMNQVNIIKYNRMTLHSTVNVAEYFSFHDLPFKSIIEQSL